MYEIPPRQSNFKCIYKKFYVNNGMCEVGEFFLNNLLRRSGAEVLQREKNFTKLHTWTYESTKLDCRGDASLAFMPEASYLPCGHT